MYRFVDFIQYILEQLMILQYGTFRNTDTSFFLYAKRDSLIAMEIVAAKVD